MDSCVSAYADKQLWRLWSVYHSSSIMIYVEVERGGEEEGDEEEDESSSKDLFFPDHIP